jgi:hypothetical protein
VPNKWLESDFNLSYLSDELLGTLSQCGMIIANLGKTYLADRLTTEGLSIESAIDHTYMSSELCNKSSVQKLTTSSTDHLPITANISYSKKPKGYKNVQITKRCMKNFNTTNWNLCLATRDWESIGTMTEVDEMAKQFSILVNEALDDIAPLKKVTCKPGYVHGLSNYTKQLMAERDSARRQIKSTPGDRWIALQKYKTLRNRVTKQIREEVIHANGKRMDEASSESEYWKIIKDINDPPSVNSWKLLCSNDSETVIVNEAEIATKFNEHFVDKIENLKANIDTSLKTDPLQFLKKKVENLNLKFSLKTVSIKNVIKTMKKMKMKKSSGRDGISQACLLSGMTVLAIPLTHIINSSITAGKVPAHWKEAIVVPILKKGSKTDVNNYRPISCLVAASKVLEKIVCDQVTKFFEVNNLLPNNQHGFRATRSTMTALTAMQREWIQNTENGLITGVLIWDLSAAFDTVDTGLLCMKLRLYGFDKLSRDWFCSFLTGRSQKVRIGNSLSASLLLTSGVPQGGTLSPIIFTIYTADLELWVKKSSVFNYADDTSSSYAHKTLEIMLKSLQDDADAIINFMALNGLVANQKKTLFMLLNNKNQTPLSDPVSIRVGNTIIKQEKSTKLLGMTIEKNQCWKEHFFGKNGLISSLNKRLFMIKRVSNHIPQTKLLQLAHALWMSKLRYGLQLCTNVRTDESELKSGNIKSAQVAQNKLLRLLLRVPFDDRTSTSELLEKTGLLSVNQLAASIKLLEAWKSENVPNYPVQLEPNKRIESTRDRQLRPGTIRKWNQDAKSTAEKECFSRNTAKLWNCAPLIIKTAKSLNQTKKAIKTYFKSLPI